MYPHHRPLLALGLLLAPLVLSFASPRPVSARDTRAPLTARRVIVALQRSGLAVSRVQRQPIAGDPSGPPATEREAWGFTLVHVAHGDGRLLLFSTTQRRDIKAAWYRRVGARIIIYRNVILWLDRGLAATIVARCHSALVRAGLTL